jgi:hypothetical protein
MVSSTSCIWIDACTAEPGVVNTAIRPSPSVLTTAPPQAATALDKAPTQWVTTEVASALPRVSNSDVLPRRSANNTVRTAIRVMP